MKLLKYYTRYQHLMWNTFYSDKIIARYYVNTEYLLTSSIPKSPFTASRSSLQLNNGKLFKIIMKEISPHTKNARNVFKLPHVTVLV